MPRYVLPGGAPGLLKRGTVDIDARLKVHVPVGHGQYASVRSVSFHGTPSDCRHFHLNNPPKRGAEILVPTVVPAGGSKYKVYLECGPPGWKCDSVWAFAWKTGQHLGIFDTVAHANSYANRLHLEQAAKARGG